MQRQSPNQFTPRDRTHWRHTTRLNRLHDAANTVRLAIGVIPQVDRAEEQCTHVEGVTEWSDC